jgi:uncharacterized delta-60 repeat protein
MRGNPGSRIVFLTLSLIALFCLPSLLLADGELDPSFDGDGKVLTFFYGDVFADAVVIQPDGKIIAAGYKKINGKYYFALARYNPDGSLDNGFGGSGKLITPFGAGSAQAHSIVLQPDGKIIAVGETDFDGDKDFALARYDPNGTLDMDFGDNGLVVTDLDGSNNPAYAAALQVDGKIVVAGYVEDNAIHKFALVRYLADGALDPSFGGNGIVITNFGSLSANAYAIAIQLGKIIAAGSVAGNFAVARYNVDGSLDDSFDEDGKVITDISWQDIAEAIAIQMDGKIIVAGSCKPKTNDFALVRYNTDGSLDTSFDIDGKVTTDFGGNDHAYSVSIQPDGKIIAAGRGELSGQLPGFALSRYNMDGTLDTSFDDDGKLITNFFEGFSGWANAVAIQPNGKIVAAGWFLDDLGKYNLFALARFLGTSINTPPIANDDSFSTRINSTLNVQSPGVLGNDSDADGDALIALLAAGPMNGTLSLNSDGSFTYIPNSGFTGTDSFTYWASDGFANSNLAMVTINVRCLSPSNHSPCKP